MAELFAGRYLLVDILGAGGAGTVWRAWDRKRGRYLAAKVLAQRDAAALLRFVREQALRIEHPHVLAPNGWAAEDDQVLFTMDLMRGGSVADLLGDYGPLPVDMAGGLLAQLADGLAAVHAAGVVHRDLKPANLLLEPTGWARPHLRLSDFGIAVVLGEPRLTQQQHLIGTPGYFAPEQLRGAAPDPRQDLYGLGVVGCQLLSGQPPPDLSGATPAPPAGVPDPISAVLRRLLARDPEDRYASAEHARVAVLAAFGGVGSERAGGRTEPVEVFDHLPPLPEGFDEAGPEPAGDGGASAGDTGTAAAPRVELPGSPPPASPAPAPVAPALPGPLSVAAQPASPTPTASAAGPAPTLIGPRPGRRAWLRGPVTLLWATVGAGVLALLLGAAAVWFTLGPGAATTPTDQQCTFASVGSVAAGPDGTLFRCTLVDSDRYAWQRV